MAKNPAKIKSSTQQHLDFDDMTDDLIIFKTGWVGLVMSTTAVNFDLLSEAEQDATIYAYGAFLNSLTFPVQILIRSKKADITAYFNNLAEAEKAQVNPDLKRQVGKYRDFIQSIVQQKTVLDKKFYLIITFSPLELGFKGLGRKNVGKTKSKRQLVEDAKIALSPKRDHIIKQMARLGLTARQLTTQELIELFYDIYNPAPTGTQRVILDSASYTVPIVEPAVEVPTPAPIPSVGPASNPDLQSSSTQLAPSQAIPQEQLRPVTPQQPITPEPQPTTAPSFKTSDISAQNQQSTPAQQLTPPNPDLSPEQQTVLSDLQSATAKAAQFVNQKVQTTTTQNQNGQGEFKPNV